MSVRTAGIILFLFSLVALYAAQAGSNFRFTAIGRGESSAIAKQAHDNDVYAECTALGATAKPVDSDFNLADCYTKTINEIEVEECVDQAEYVCEFDE